MKRVIEELLIEHLTCNYEITQPDGTIKKETYKPNIYYHIPNKTLYIKPMLPPYRMVVLKRIIYNEDLPIENIVVGTPEC